MVFTFNKKYFIAAMVLFFVEVFIAIYIKDAFIRPYGGDFLVVFFLYFLIKSFFDIPAKNAILGVLLFSWFVEILQYLKIARLLGMENNNLFTTVLGSHFEWLDMLIYTLAALCIYVIEKVREQNFLKTTS